MDTSSTFFINNGIYISCSNIFFYFHKKIIDRKKENNCDKYTFWSFSLEIAFLSTYRHRHANDNSTQKQQPIKNQTFPFMHREQKYLRSQINRIEAIMSCVHRFILFMPFLRWRFRHHKKVLNSFDFFSFFVCFGICENVYVLIYNFLFVYDAWSENYLTTMWINLIVTTETVEKGNETFLLHFCFALTIIVVVVVVCWHYSLYSAGYFSID